MCSNSPVGGKDKVWCGSGWTGQPSVFERDGRRWVVFGAYDKHVHFLDAITGERILPDFPTGDIIKGSVSIDPDGYPLVYSGSRDDFLHVIAIDRAVPTELWSLAADAVSPTLWNNDWDGSPLVLGDFLFEGGENSQLHVVKLNRGYDAGGKVTVAPQLVFNAPGWDAELLNAIGDNDVSIEGSVAVSGDTIYFANSGGLVQGWDISGLEDGEAPTRTFRFWTGDDTDASVVVDADGMLYVGSEYERSLPRSKQVGQLMKLDPSKPADPLVWSVADSGEVPSGIWATPALHRDVVYVATNGGRLLAVDRKTGAIRWEKLLPGPTWQSPVVVDDVLIEGDCNGVLHAYDVKDTTVEPPELWSLALDTCIESTPAVFKGRLYVGTRGGFWFIIGDPPTTATTAALKPS
jgi:outer membrane protein assembly factor BamB